MNERILEAAFQSLFINKRMSDGSYFIDDPELMGKLEKFAELIVKEAGAYLMQPEFIGRNDLDWSMILNEHFGVKE